MNEKYPTVHVDPVIITKDFRVVLALRAEDIEGGGKWHLPGGQVLYGDTILDALKRHTLRKTGLKIDFYYPFEKKSLVIAHTNPKRDRRGHFVALVFLCKLVGGDLKPGENIQDVKFFSERELKNIDIGWDHREMIEDAFKKLGI